MYGYDSALASLLPANSELLKKLIAMIDEEERFRAGEYKKHLHDESPCRDHCMGHLLSAFKNASFRGDCDHGRADGKEIAAGISMRQRGAPRQPKSSDWGETCAVCSTTIEEDRSGLLCCENCPSAVHRKCIEANFNDIGETWTCPPCVSCEDARQHDERCLKCERHAFLMENTKKTA